jgi:predicted amidohydrolase YtcJ
VVAVDRDVLHTEPSSLGDVGVTATFVDGVAVFEQ